NKHQFIGVIFGIVLQIEVSRKTKTLIKYLKRCLPRQTLFCYNKKDILSEVCDAGKFFWMGFIFN
ncbi:MAG: hypothetical protein KBS60_03155, partial [Phascolarctobacterium sp.]|nr:hypothetical protein [Candidatus Phascolarctobacterium caballi]